MGAWKIRGCDYEVVLLEQYINVPGQKRMEPFLKTEYLESAINDFEQKGSGYLFIDMRGIHKAASRVFSFLLGKEILDRLIFFHVQKPGEVRNNLNQDLHGKTGKLNKEDFVYFSEEACAQFKKYKKRKFDILKSYTNKKITFLQSSGIYSNMSLDYKKLFENPEQFSFIIDELYYQLCCIRQKESIDFLVAASKNAIALTAILSSRLEIPAIYHTNIGQKYVKKGNFDEVTNQKDSRAKKQYVMIFDVICLGTEARILNGIVNVFGGNLIGAVGLVCVQDPKEIQKHNADSILAKAQCLATAREMNLGYRIALTREELEGE